MRCHFSNCIPFLMGATVSQKNFETLIIDIGRSRWASRFNCWIVVASFEMNWRVLFPYHYIMFTLVRLWHQIHATFSFRDAAALMSLLCLCMMSSMPSTVWGTRLCTVGGRGWWSMSEVGGYDAPCWTGGYDALCLPHELVPCHGEQASPNAT